MLSKPFGFEKPHGMRDTLPALYETKAWLRKQMMEGIQRWGYRFVETPALEYYDTVGTAAAIEEGQLFKLLDQDGKTLVLRPDMTAPIARIAASSLKDEAYPLRMAYDASVFRAQKREGGHPAEFEQIGVELIGDGSAGADAEIIALMIHVLKQAGLRQFQAAVGHIGYINTLLAENVDSKERANGLRRLLYEKNVVGFRRAVEELNLSGNGRERLLALLDLRGGRKKLNTAAQLIDDPRGKKMLSDLTALMDILDSYGVGQHIKLDFTLVSHMDYYTGIVFEGYNGSVGFPLASGGRYDELLGRFHRPAPATGFGVFFDRLVEAVGPIGEKPSSCCILYTENHREEAIALAHKKRAAGEIVVLQDREGVSDEDAFVRSFNEVVYDVGKEADR
ncbi:MAG TPA: ATP phosphoribosyltransferase regulatory subunit [Bacillales bacterium]|nr:ATP phosphoribosyltransferase regulatory subunit [Bacillales bacterium]